VCVVSRKSKFARAITLKQYLAAEHVAVDIIGGVQTHPDRHLAAIGEKRHCPLVVAQHTVAMHVAAVTEMIATVPRRMAVLEASNKATKIIAPRSGFKVQGALGWRRRLARHLLVVIVAPGFDLSSCVAQTRPHSSLNYLPPAEFARTVVEMGGMRKASTALLEQGTQTPSPAPDLIPAETSTENLHWDWSSKRGHFTYTISNRGVYRNAKGMKQRELVEEDLSFPKN
jgi:hypothetical protein